MRISVSVCIYVSCVNGRERRKDSCRRVKMQLPDLDRATDQVSCLSGEFMISKARPWEIGKIFCLLGHTRSYENGFPFNHFRESLCNFIENLIAYALILQNIFKMHNHLRESKMGLYAQCSGFVQIMQSIKWRLLVALITIKKIIKCWTRNIKYSLIRCTISQ